MVAIARGMLFTGLVAVGSTLIMWMLIIMAVDRQLPYDDMIVWAATLWATAILCTAAVGWSRFAIKPVLACTIAFGLFAYGYLLCEGAIFGEVTEGGDPAMTKVVVWTMIPLPVGMFLVSEASAVLGRLWRKNPSRPTVGPIRQRDSR